MSLPKLLPPRKVLIPLSACAILAAAPSLSRSGPAAHHAARSRYVVIDSSVPVGRRGLAAPPPSPAGAKKNFRSSPAHLRSCGDVTASLMCCLSSDSDAVTYGAFRNGPSRPPNRSSTPGSSDLAVLSKGGFPAAI